MRTALLGTSSEPPRAAFSVGRSVGGAVTRNQVRRRLRCALREHSASLQPGTGYLVRATPGAAATSYAELSDSLRAILSDISGGKA